MRLELENNGKLDPDGNTKKQAKKDDAVEKNNLQNYDVGVVAKKFSPSIKDKNFIVQLAPSD